MSDIEKAKQLLASGEYTCVLCKNNEIFTSVERGVKPLVKWYESNHIFKGFSAADKVIGKGAAFLYILLGISDIYADVISIPALELLQLNGIHTEYKTKTNCIINRKGDGVCPFEMSVMNICDAELAYSAIRKKMKEMAIKI